MNSRSDTMSSCLMDSRPSLLHLSAAAASTEGLDTLDDCDASSFRTNTPLNEQDNLSASAPTEHETRMTMKSTRSSGASNGMVSPENPPLTPEKQPLAASANLPKAATFEHLKQKYLKELEYMLVEFRKLEKQLLGAKAATRETAGSKERREKLHSFIVHLDETIQQIHCGCRSALPNSDIDDEETVVKLEEHILANLLPVKVRLKKQLAAQQGAKHNPTTMPTRGTMNASVSVAAGPATLAMVKDSKATFVPTSTIVAATAPRKPVDSHFGKPLAGGGSSLTQKLHGPTLGSTRSKSKPISNKILYAGMAIGSEQIESSVHAATSVHKFVIQDSSLLELHKLQQQQNDDFFADTNPDMILSDKLSTIHETPKPANEALEKLRLRLIRKRRKRKRQKQRELLQKQQLQQVEPVAKKRKQAAAACPKKRGPRAVEYICALCNEVYSSSCEYNTWWALSQQECPKCRKGQIPRIDISAPSNAIEYHPALLAHVDDANATATPAPVESMQVPAPALKLEEVASDSDSLGSDLTDEDWDGLDSDDDLPGSELSEDEPLTGMSPPELAERERFGAEYTGPACDDDEASRLLVLMGHAATCLCQHKLPKHRDVCRSAKYMMLHVRDCPGTTFSFDVCPFPWCRKVKHLLHHLVTCQEQEYCSICSPTDLSPNFAALRGLNEHRFCKLREKLTSKAQISADARANASYTKPTKKGSKPPSSAESKTDSLDSTSLLAAEHEFLAELEAVEPSEHGDENVDEVAAFLSTSISCSDFITTEADVPDTNLSMERDIVADDPVPNPFAKSSTVPMPVFLTDKKAKFAVKSEGLNDASEATPFAQETDSSSASTSAKD
ncbi:hypothetical protein MPSEU_000859000 [Mayamaea pseudoterrestris]|nr:hypothetical protein MPSEU_000859000 [Mayamaea pseudoterrestris]